MFDIFGYLGAFFTTASFFPQVIYTLKTKDTSSISLTMYLMFAAGVVFWLVYGILIGNPVIMIANIITLMLSGTILFMKIKNLLNSKKSISSLN